MISVTEWLICSPECARHSLKEPLWPSNTLNLQLDILDIEIFFISAARSYLIRWLFSIHLLKHQKVFASFYLHHKFGLECLDQQLWNVRFPPFRVLFSIPSFFPVQTHTQCWTSVDQAGPAAAVSVHTPPLRLESSDRRASFLDCGSHEFSLLICHADVSCICLQITVVVT